MKKILFCLVLALFLGCSVKDSELFNLTPEEWYAQIIKDINNADLEAADEHFTSFSSEHVASNLLPQVMIVLAQSHIEEEEDYSQSNFYLDEYIKKYGDSKSIEFAEFLKIKANFDSFSKPNRNQKLILDSIQMTQKFLEKYPQSVYFELVSSMLTKLNLANLYLNNSIKELYERTDRIESAQTYEEKLQDYDENNIIKPKLPWYNRPFE